jgi:hypothetical protein
VRRRGGAGTGQEAEGIQLADRNESGQSLVRDLGGREGRKKGQAKDTA